MQKKANKLTKGPGATAPALSNTPGKKSVVKSAFVMRANPVLKKDRVEESISLTQRPIIEDYARFLNDSDDLLHELLQVVANSPTCDSIIGQKHALTLGDGFTVVRGGGLLTRSSGEVTDADLAQIEAVITQVNGDGESIVDVLSAVVRDYWQFGNAFIGFSKAGTQVFCYHVPFTKARLRRRNEMGDVDTIGVCLDWKNWNTTQAKKYSVYPNFTPDENGVDRCIMHLSDYRPGMDYYGLPDYISGILAATLEYYIDRRNLSKMENSNIPSGILQFFGANTVEEAEEIVADAKKQFSGLGKNGGLLIQALADSDLKAVFTSIENPEKEGEMLELQTSVAQKIATAHRWTTALAGIATAGKLGTNQQIIQEFEFVQSTVIRPAQNMLLRKFVNKFLRANGITDLSLEIKNSTPTSFFGAINPDTALTVDEKRDEMGFDALPQLSADEYTEIRNSLSGFSPLVANKILEVMTPEELREMIGLKGKGNDTNTGTGSN